jgi:hypothetical protein
MKGADLCKGFARDAFCQADANTVPIGEFVDRLYAAAQGFFVSTTCLKWFSRIKDGTLKSEASNILLASTWWPV